MNIDQRLHRAAHALRELEVEIPPLPDDVPARGAASLRRLGAPVATVMLIAVVAVGAIAELAPTGRATEQAAAETGAAAAAIDSPSAVAPPRERPLSAREEVAMIAALNRTSSPVASDREPPRWVPPGVS